VLTGLALSLHSSMHSIPPPALSLPLLPLPVTLLSWLATVLPSCGLSCAMKRNTSGCLADVNAAFLSCQKKATGTGSGAASTQGEDRLLSAPTVSTSSEGEMDPLLVGDEAVGYGWDRAEFSLRAR
jgi:hypothetical protein